MPSIFIFNVYMPLLMSKSKEKFEKLKIHKLYESRDEMIGQKLKKNTNVGFFIAFS
jgi:hypothetical protein